MRFFYILFFAFVPFFGTTPAKNAEVYLERGAKNELVAFQKTGSKGKVSFRHLDTGSYRLLLTFPQQRGKFIREKPRHESMTKATYNPKSKTYYYQGKEGFFAIQFSGVSKINREQFKAVYKEDNDKNDVVYSIIAEFSAHTDGAAISLDIDAITAAKFKRATERIEDDISTQSIRGMK